MVRRTKEEAQATRSHILDTAELVFEQHGVSGTSLAEIAKAAGLTRGAIYWHFHDKADLFNAMMDRVTLPLEQTDPCGFKGSDITLTQMRAGFVDMLRKVTTDPQLRRVFEIATHKVEYVGEMNAVRAHHVAMRNDCLVDMERAFRRARRAGALPKSSLTARNAALGMLALFDGLLQNWMLDHDGFDLLRVGGQVFDAYLRGLGHAA